MRLLRTLPILIVAAAIGGCDAPAAPTGSPSRIAVLGDSLALSPSRALAFPAILQARATTDARKWTVLNASELGATSADGLARLDTVLDERPAILILALGANDGLDGVPIRVIKDNLGAIIARSTARGVRVLLCGMETPPFRGLGYSLDFHNLFRDLARDHGVPLVPFLLSGVVLNPDMNRSDLIHPNAAGARQIAGNIWPYLEPMLGE